MLQIRESPKETNSDSSNKCLWYDSDCYFMTENQIFRCYTNVFDDFDYDIVGDCPMFNF
jgi:hypothetical protein